MEAEREGLKHPAAFADPAAAAAASSTNGNSKQLALPAAAADSSKGDEEPAGQEVDLAWPAIQKEGTYNLQLIVLSDCWVGADETMAVRRLLLLGGWVMGLKVVGVFSPAAVGYRD